MQKLLRNRILKQAETKKPRPGNNKAVMPRLEPGPIPLR
jgi:hypothetical protein